MTLSEGKYPILDFDDSKDSITDPQEVIEGEDLPERAVIVFLKEIIEKLEEDWEAERVDEIEMTTMKNFPIFKISHDGMEITVANSPPGAPAAVGVMEELVARGCNKIIACGNAGVLREDLKRGSVMIVESAVRDEGTSYHYAFFQRNTCR